MTPEDKKRFISKAETYVSQLPWYIQEFFEYKYNASAHTQYNYSIDTLHFLQWLIKRKKLNCDPIDVSIHQLDQLRIQDITAFERYCLLELNNRVPTVARKLSSLKSIFHYLSQVAEDEEMYPYLQRNVMAKIDIKRERISKSKQAELIASRILVDNEFNEFREFIAEGYGKLLLEQNQTRKYKAHLRNRERDLALVSTLLGSGLRIAEALTIDIDKIDWRNNTAEVIRKGDSLDIVSFSDVAREDIKEYLKVRDKYYAPPKSQKALFLASKTSKQGIANRLSVRAAQRMFDQYIDAFGRNGVTLHKLRHSFATRHYKENQNLALLQRVLDHRHIETTVIYTHVFDKEIKDSINKTDN